MHTLLHMLHLLPFVLSRAQQDLYVGMISLAAQTDNAVCTGGTALACGFAFNGSAHSLKHVRQVPWQTAKKPKGVG